MDIPHPLKNKVDFALYCVGRDPTNRATAQLLFDPGHPETYRADAEPNLIGLEDAYSSLSFNHIGLIRTSRNLNHALRRDRSLTDAVQS